MWKTIFVRVKNTAVKMMVPIVLVLCFVNLGAIHVPTMRRVKNYDTAISFSCRNTLFHRNFALEAKKKGSKFISDDLLSTLESEIEEKEKIKLPEISVEGVEAKSINIKDKKLGKLGLSSDLLSSLIDSEEDETSGNKKKKDKKKDKKKSSSSNIEDDANANANDSYEENNFVNEKQEAAATLEVNDEVSQSEQIVEQSVRRDKPSSRVRFTESTQPGYVMMGLEKVGLMYGNEVILKDATFSVQTGERVGLVGPNGGGKVEKIVTFK